MAMENKRYLDSVANAERKHQEEKQRKVGTRDIRIIRKFRLTYHMIKISATTELAALRPLTAI